MKRRADLLKWIRNCAVRDNHVLRLPSPPAVNTKRLVKCVICFGRWRKRVLSALQKNIALGAGKSTRDEHKQLQMGITNGISANDVVSCIEMILGRTPDQGLVDYHLGLGFANRFELGAYMINTDEFKSRLQGRGDAYATDEWSERANRAYERKSKLRSFGPNAYGLLVNTKHGFFAVDVEDSAVSSALLNDGCYHDDELDILKSLVSKNSRVLIVGAHIGVHAIPLSRICSQMIAVEANPQTYTYLNVNLKINHCSNVTTYNVAAGDKEETIEFLMSRENSGGSKRKPAISQVGYVYDNPEIIDIPAIPLDNIFNASELDLIVMDIEGSEYFALKGMKRILSLSKVLAVEFLPHHLRFIANVGPSDFIATILPYYNWMYIAEDGSLTPQHEIARRVCQMYDDSEGHDLIYFFKEISPSWLESQRASLLAP